MIVQSKKQWFDIVFNEISPSLEMRYSEPTSYPFYVEFWRGFAGNIGIKKIIYSALKEKA